MRGPERRVGERDWRPEGIDFDEVVMVCGDVSAEVLMGDRDSRCGVSAGVLLDQRDGPRIPVVQGEGEIDYPTRQVREGLVDFLVPDIPRRPGPGSRSMLPFYNPAMAVARDVSVLLAERTAPRGAAGLDGLAAAGGAARPRARRGGGRRRHPPR